MKASSRVITNTVFLYAKLLLAMAIGLFTTRFVLKALGEINYGTYSLVAGVIGMLAFLQGALSSASMRFISISLGSGDEKSNLKTFNTTLYLHVGLGLMLFIIMELGGIIMFNYFVNIPVARLFAAKIVFQFMVATTFIAVISVPYDAVMNAHENMVALSLIDLFGYMLRLGAAIYLLFCSLDRLITYGLLMLIIQLVLRIIKQQYSAKKYPECRINFKKHLDKPLIKKIFSFSSWTLLGSVSSMAANQLQSIVLNMFFGVRLNAANGISRAASSQVNSFSNSMTIAIRPQLVKSEGSGDRAKMLMYTVVATKYSIFLFALFAIPVFVELPYLLNIWLTIVPDYTIIFCRLMLIGLFIEKASFEIGTAINAVGNIKGIYLAESCMILFSVVLAYIAFSLGFPPYSFYVILILLGFLIMSVRIYFGKVIAGLKVKNFFKGAILPAIVPILMASIISVTPSFLMNASFTRFAISLATSTIILCISFRYIGLTKSEFKKIKALVTSGLFKLRTLLVNQWK